MERVRRGTAESPVFANAKMRPNEVPKVSKMKKIVDI